MVDTVEVGRIGKPFGIRGEVYVHPDADLGAVITEGSYLNLADGREVCVRRAHWHGERFIVSFEGTSTRDEAEGLRGEGLFVARQQVQLHEGTYWVNDLINQLVVDIQGQPVGTIIGVKDGTAHDWLVLEQPDGRHSLIPHVAAIIDVDRVPFVIDPPEGLLDLE